MNNYQKLIDEYSKEYCLFLEATYSHGMMSEGGAESIDAMFKGVNLDNKNILEIGFGLGGAIFHLADNYKVNMAGIELNPWMAEEATRRTPEHLKSKVKFVSYKTPPALPFPDLAFDIIFSKGVLTHVEEKQGLFNEVFRVLKPGGLFIVNDWLSPIKDQWSKNLQKMCEIENLTLFAETKDDYIHHLENSGFSEITIRDENQDYAKYNDDIVKELKSEKVAAFFINKFGKKAWKDAIEGYQLIADSIRSNELLVTLIKSTK